LKIGDKVKLKYIPNDLRYDVKLEDIGVVTELIDAKRGYNIGVKWYKSVPAMSHKPEELEVVNEQLERLKEMIKIMETNIANHYAEKAERADKITDSSTAIRQLNYLENQQLIDEGIIREFLDLAERFL
jgi:hypothetical protein